MTAPLLLTSRLARCETVLHGCGTILVHLFYAIVTVFQLYHGSDMMYKMRRKPEPTHLETQGIFNLPHHVGMEREQLAFGGTVNYTQWGNGLQDK